MKSWIRHMFTRCRNFMQEGADTERPRGVPQVAKLSADTRRRRGVFNGFRDAPRIYRGDVCTSLHAEATQLCAPDATKTATRERCSHFSRIVKVQ